MQDTLLNTMQFYVNLAYIMWALIFILLFIIIKVQLRNSQNALKKLKGKK